MATNVTWNGTTYPVPATGEENWGGSTKLDGLIIALAQYGLQRTGGSFTLSADVDFGASAGLKSTYYKSRGTVSSAGVIRLAKTESIGWRNNADSGNNLLTTDTSDRLTYNGTVVLSSTGVVPVAAGGTNITSYTIGDLLYASGTTTLSKLAIGSTGQVNVVAGGVPTWGAALIAGGGTGLTSYTAGDTLYYASGTALSKLAIGTASYVMTSSGTAPQWGLLVNANIDAAAAIARTKLASGTASHVLINDGSGVMSSEASLLETRGGTHQTTYTTGDILYASGSNTLSKLGIGAAGKPLVVSGGVPAWATLGETAGGTNQTTYTQGDILYASASNTLSKLAAGTSGQFLKTNGAGANPSWATISVTAAVSAKSANFNAVNTDDVYLVTTAASTITATLPAAASNTGKIFYFKKVDSGAGKITLDGNASETIDGATTLDITVQYETVAIVCDGSNWYIL